MGGNVWEEKDNHCQAGVGCRDWVLLHHPEKPKVHPAAPCLSQVRPCRPPACPFQRSKDEVMTPPTIPPPLPTCSCAPPPSSSSRPLLREWVWVWKLPSFCASQNPTSHPPTLCRTYTLAEPSFQH